jgi:ABC-2 type transport system ATP-binding protein
MLTLEQVTKRFGALTAIDSLDLTIPKGMIFGLLGPNGAGKTTLLRMIMGLIPPSSGAITLFERYRPNHREVKKRIGYMPQQLAVYPGLTVRENVRFFGRLYNMPEKELRPRADRLIDLVELAPRRDTLVARLSGGMIRRVMLATALIHRPALVILDEPTAGVDPVLRMRFWNWFRQLVDGGTSILVTTHHISEAAQSEAVVFLRQGHIIDQGSPADLMQRYGAQNLEEAFVHAVPEAGQHGEGRA